MCFKCTGQEAWLLICCSNFLRGNQTAGSTRTRIMLIDIGVYIWESSRPGVLCGHQSAPCKPARLQPAPLLPKLTREAQSLVAPASLPLPRSVERAGSDKTPGGGKRGGGRVVPIQDGVSPPQLQPGYGPAPGPSSP